MSLVSLSASLTTSIIFLSVEKLRGWQKCFRCYSYIRHNRRNKNVECLWGLSSYMIEIQVFFFLVEVHNL